MRDAFNVIRKLTACVYNTVEPPAVAGGPALQAAGGQLEFRGRTRMLKVSLLKIKRGVQGQGSRPK